MSGHRYVTFGLKILLGGRGNSSVSFCLATELNISVDLIMSVRQTVIDDPSCLIDSPNRAASSPTYLSNSESYAYIFSPSPCSKRAYVKTGTSLSSKRQLLPSLSSVDRSILQELRKESDRSGSSDDQDLDHIPRWAAELR